MHGKPQPGEGTAQRHAYARGRGAARGETIDMIVGLAIYGLSITT